MSGSTAILILVVIAIKITALVILFGGTEQEHT